MKRRGAIASALTFFAAWRGNLPAAEAFEISKPTASRFPFIDRTDASQIALQSSRTPSSTPPTTDDALAKNGRRSQTPTTRNVLFQDFSLPVEEFGTSIPVACWWPQNPTDEQSTTTASFASYAHRISVQRIGELLAQWDLIPSFASRNFELQPTLEQHVYKSTLDSWKGPVVILAHGYLGSRFDLSHLAEKLATEGFLCLSPEYPESLAASYERQAGLDRSVINNRLLSDNNLSRGWKIDATSFGIVGHSLGTATVLNTGDDSWARVCLAGFPRQRDGSSVSGNLLLICSLNDGAMSLQRFGGKSAFPNDFAMFSDDILSNAGSLSMIPRRSAVVLESGSAPNHISFLSAGVNDAMIDLLSPLLPVAQWMNIPVLDFDRYQVSRDAVPTAASLHPLIIQYLKQEMELG